MLVWYVVDTDAWYQAQSPSLALTCLEVFQELQVDLPFFYDYDFFFLEIKRSVGPGGEIRIRPAWFTAG